MRIWNSRYFFFSRSNGCAFLFYCTRISFGLLYLRKQSLPVYSSHEYFICLGEVVSSFEKFAPTLIEGRMNLSDLIHVHKTEQISWSRAKIRLSRKISNHLMRCHRSLHRSDKVSKIVCRLYTLQGVFRG